MAEKKDSEARSHLVLRVVSILAVGAVAGALLVGFFYGGDFGKAWKDLSGGKWWSSEVTEAATAQVVGIGAARFDGRCNDSTIAGQASTGAKFSAKKDAEDRCMALPGAKVEAGISLRPDIEAEPTLEQIGGKCVANVQITYTCLFSR